jgi:hypothetical protein
MSACRLFQPHTAANLPMPSSISVVVGKKPTRFRSGYDVLQAKHKGENAMVTSVPAHHPIVQPLF